MNGEGRGRGREREREREGGGIIHATLTLSLLALFDYIGRYAGQGRKGDWGCMLLAFFL